MVNTGARDYINDQGWKIIGAIIGVAIIFMAGIGYKVGGAAAEKAQAAMDKAQAVDQHVEQIASDVVEIKIATKEISEAVKVLTVIAAEQGKDISYHEERLKRLEDK